ncbi:MAG TPA: nucleotide exchange factor GrpE [Verrucomicrobiae bacterium]|nr:nucleotide exchange factor GrpE [Verrucomicrobiae bacterium]
MLRRAKKLYGDKLGASEGDLGQVKDFYFDDQNWIEDSPSIEWHKPVSRQYEEAYHRYYGWPFYWLGDGLWGMSGTPILESPPKPSTGKQNSATDPKPKNTDPHRQEALSQGHNPAQLDHSILEMVQRGFIKGPKVIRPAKVVVNGLTAAKPPRHGR